MKNPDWKVTDLLLRVILTKAGDWIADLIKESLVIRTDTTEWLDQKKKNKVHLVIWVKIKLLLQPMRDCRDSKI